jgi:peptidoglycan-associated lipoprotein
MKLSNSLLLTSMICLLALISACAKPPVMDTAPVAAPVEAPVAAVAVAPAPEVTAVTMTTLTGSQLEPVYFDFDSHALSSAARQTLERNAALLNQTADLVVVVEGHSDERGSDEYNLALGEQRAAAVKGYLVTLGVSAGRMKAISYGEERPAVIGTDEAFWSQNRRSAFN